MSDDLMLLSLRGVEAHLRRQAFGDSADMVNKAIGILASLPQPSPLDAAIVEAAVEWKVKCFIPARHYDEAAGLEAAAKLSDAVAAKLAAQADPAPAWFDKLLYDNVGLNGSAFARLNVQNIWNELKKLKVIRDV